MWKRGSAPQQQPFSTSHMPLCKHCKAQPPAQPPLPPKEIMHAYSRDTDRISQDVDPLFRVEETHFFQSLKARSHVKIVRSRFCGHTFIGFCSLIAWERMVFLQKFLFTVFRKEPEPPHKYHTCSKYPELKYHIVLGFFFHRKEPTKNRLSGHQTVEVFQYQAPQAGFWFLSEPRILPSSESSMFLHVE